MRRPKASSKKIDTEKCLISAVWSVNGIHSLLDVPKGTTYNTTFFYDVVILDLLENVSAWSQTRTLKGIVMHFDNASPHNSKKSNECLTEFDARRVPHPTYSPDRARSDFFLFGMVTAELQNYEIHSREDLILAIRTVFGQISKETFISVYVSCMKRLKWVIKNGRKYIHN
jgi:hypothetical protein